MSGSATRSITMLGAGIVGVCCALSLQRNGFSVCLIDRGEPGAGCSSGNAGMIQTGLILPLAVPGILMRAPRMLLDPEGPPGPALATSPEVAPVAARIGQKREPGKGRNDDTCSGGLANAGQGCLSDFGGGHPRIRPLSVSWRTVCLSQRCRTGDARREVRRVARPWHRLCRNPRR